MKEFFGEFFAVTVVVIVVIALCFAIIIPLSMLLQTPGRTLFNKHYGTEYSATQWLFGNRVIKDYLHTGENKKLNINLGQDYDTK